MNVAVKHSKRSQTTPSGGRAKCFVYVKEGQTIVGDVCLSVCGVCNAHVASSCWQPVKLTRCAKIVAGHNLFENVFTVIRLLLCFLFLANSTSMKCV